MKSTMLKIETGDIIEEAIKSLKFIRKARSGKPTPKDETITLVPVTVNGEETVGIAKASDTGETFKFEVMWIALTPGMKIEVPDVDPAVAEVVPAKADLH